MHSVGNDPLHTRTFACNDPLPNLLVSVDPLPDAAHLLYFGGCFSVDVIDSFLNHLQDPVVSLLQDVGHGLGRAPRPLTRFHGNRGELIGRKPCHIVLHHLQGEKAGEVLLLVAHHHGIADEGKLLFDEVLDGDRCNLLPTGRDDNLFLAASDVQKSLLEEYSNMAKTVDETRVCSW